MASKIVASYGIEFTSDTRKIKKEIGEVDKSLVGVGKGATRAGKNVDKFGLNLDRAATRLGSITRLGGTAGNMLSLGVSAGFAGASVAAVGFGVAMQKAIATGINFESAFAGVIKTVDASSEVLGSIRQDFINLSQQIPQSAAALASIGEVAGQLGVDAENITSFTATVADLGVTTNLSTTDAATGLARLINITEGSFSTIENLGSALVDLGNNSATTEAEILGMSLRIAGAGKQVGLTEADILGFAAALSSLGVRAEAGGSAISRTFIEIDKAVTEGGGKLADFAEVAGMSAQEFVQLWGTDAAAATIAFSEGLGVIADTGGDVFGTLERLELGEIRVRDALLRLAGSGTLAAESISLSNDAFREGNALSEEAAKRYETTQAKIDVFKNSIQATGIALFDELKPGLDESIESLTELVQVLPGAIQGASDLAKAVGALEGLSATIEISFKFAQGSVEVLGVIGSLLDENTEQGKAFGAAMQLMAINMHGPLLIVRDTLRALESAQFDNSEETVKQVDAWREATEAYRRGEDALGDSIVRQWGGFEATKAYTEAIEAGNEALIFREQAIDRDNEAQQRHNDLLEGGFFHISQMGQRIMGAADSQDVLAASTFNLADALFVEANAMHEISAESLAKISNASDATVARIAAAFGSLPEITGSEIDSIVSMVLGGVITIDDATGMLTSESIPELNEAFGELANDLNTSYLEAMADGGGGAAEFADKLDLVDQIMRDLNITARGGASAILDLASAFDEAQSMVDIFNDQGSMFGGVASTMEDAYDILIEKKDKGNELTEIEQRFLEKYPDLFGRATAGQDEATVQAGLWAAIQGELILLQDDVNAGLEISKDRLADTARNVQGVASDTGVFTEETRDLLSALLGVNVTMEGLDGQEANIAVNLLEGAGSTAGQRGGPTRFEQRAEDLGITGKIDSISKNLINLDGSKATVTTTADIIDNATEPLENILSVTTYFQEGRGNFTVHALMDTSNFDEGTVHVDESSPSSPAKKGPLSKVPNWDYLFEGLDASAQKWTESALKHIKLFLDTGKAAFDTFSAEIEFLELAGDFEASGGGLPSDALIADLKAFTEHILQSVGDSAALFKVEFLDHAKEYADSASAGISLISDAVGILADLSGVDFDLDKAKASASLLKFLTEAIVLDVGDSAAIIESGQGIDHPSVRGEGFVGAAEAYATGAEAAVSLIGEAASALADLGNLEIDLDAAKAAASQLKFLTEAIVLDIGDSAAVVMSDVDHPSSRGEGFIGIAKEYAEGAKVAVELVGEGVSFIAAMADFEGDFNLAEAENFASNLKFLIEHIAISIGDSAALIAASRPEDFNDEMNAFAEAAGPALSTMEDAVSFLGAMADLGEELMMPSLEEIEKFAGDAVIMIRAIADAFREASKGWGVDAEGAEAGTVNAELLNFADGADAALGTLDSVFSVLEGFNTLLGQDTMLSTEQVRGLAQFLAEQVRAIAEEFKLASEGWGKVDEALAAFSEDANNSLDLVDGAVGALLALVKWDEEDSDLNIKQAAEMLVINMDILLEAIEGIVLKYKDRGVPAWGEFADSVKTSFDMVSSASKAFVDLAEISRLTPEMMGIFIDNWDIVLDGIEEVAAMIEERGLTAAKGTLEIAQEIVDLLSEAAALMGGAEDDSGGGKVFGTGGGGGGAVNQTLNIDAIATFGEAIEFVEALIDLQSDLDMDDALQFVDDLGAIIRAMVSEMAQSFNMFDASFLAQGQKFADIALTTVEVFEKVYDQIGNIIAFQFTGGLLTEGAVNRWAQWMASIARTMVGGLEMAIEDWVGSEGLVEQVGFFADVASDTLSTFDKVINTVDKIASWGDTPPITHQQASEAGAWLSETAKILTEEFITASQEWVGVNAALTAFAEDANNSLSLVIGTVDAVEAIRKMPMITTDQINVFLHNLNVILSAILGFSSELAGAIGSSALPTISSPPLGQAAPPVFSSSPSGPGGPSGPAPNINVTVNANTNASPHEIAVAVADVLDRAQTRYG